MARVQISVGDVVPLVVAHFPHAVMAHGQGMLFGLMKRRLPEEDPKLPIYRPLFESRANISSRDVEQVIETSRSAQEAAFRIINWFETGQPLNTDPREEDFQRRVQAEVEKQLAKLGTINVEGIAEKVAGALRAEAEKRPAPKKEAPRIDQPDRPSMEEVMSWHAELTANGVKVNPIPPKPNGGFQSHVMAVYRRWRQSQLEHA